MGWQVTGGAVLGQGHAERSTRVLIVDDHDLFRTGLRLLLGQHGYEVADAAGADAGLRRLQSFRPDVVVMDVDMPGMSGIAATRRLLAQAPGTVVVMLSAVAVSARTTAAAPSETREQSVRFSGPATIGFLSETVRQNS